MRDRFPEISAPKQRKKIPFEFVLEELAVLRPWTREMFGSTAVYVEEKIVFVLRNKPERKDGCDGVWLATTKEHHASLRREMPSLHSITALRSDGETGWQMLPVSAADFEQSVLRACELVRAGDARIGKVPKSKRGAWRRAEKGKLGNARPRE
jgi:hypothetical protein